MSSDDLNIQIDSIKAIAKEQSFATLANKKWIELLGRGLPMLLTGEFNFEVNESCIFFNWFGVKIIAKPRVVRSKNELVPWLIEYALYLIRADSASKSQAAEYFALFYLAPAASVHDREQGTGYSLYKDVELATYVALGHHRESVVYLLSEVCRGLLEHLGGDAYSPSSPIHKDEFYVRHPD